MTSQNVDTISWTISLEKEGWGDGISKFCHKFLVSTARDGEEGRANAK